MDYLHIHTEKSIPKVPSASAIETVNGEFWVVGDDSNALFRLNAEGQIIGQIELFDSPYDSSERIPKSEKPDFEAMCRVGDEVWVVGSGSKRKNRDRGFRVNIKTHEVTEFSLSPLYNALREAFSKLNIEGLAHEGSHFVLANRGNQKQDSHLILAASLSEATHKIYPITNVPDIDGVRSGCSELDYQPHNERLVLCFTAEDTDNPIDDGAIKGSYLAWLDRFVSHHQQQDEIRLVNFARFPSVMKIEGITTDQDLTFVAVSDSDDGTSGWCSGRLPISV